MENDSIETLLLRHYGNLAPAPAAMEQQLLASVRTEVAKKREQQQAITRLQAKRVSRRRAVGLVAKGTAELGLGLLSVGLEGLQSLETALGGQEGPKPQTV